MTCELCNKEYNRNIDCEQSMLRITDRKLKLELRKAYPKLSNFNFLSIFANASADFEANYKHLNVCSECSQKERKESFFSFYVCDPT